MLGTTGALAADVAPRVPCVLALVESPEHTPGPSLVEVLHQLKHDPASRVPQAILVDLWHDEGGSYGVERAALAKALEGPATPEAIAALEAPLRARLRLDELDPDLTVEWTYDRGILDTVSVRVPSRVFRAPDALVSGLGSLFWLEGPPRNVSVGLVVPSSQTFSLVAFGTLAAAVDAAILVAALRHGDAPALERIARERFADSAEDASFLAVLDRASRGLSVRVHPRAREALAGLENLARFLEAWRPL